MKKTKLILLLLAFVLSLGAQTNRQTAKKTTKSQPKTVIFNVSMHCQACTKKIENAIGWEKGVKDLKADLVKKTVTISYDPTKTAPEQLKEKIKKLGYTVTEQPAKGK
ncbi:MAG: heavy-metal-associated domain-containing protein [Prevotella sp.]|nr:heavy-metal-associated domain-containing protein [Prevotella sp.]